MEAIIRCVDDLENLYEIPISPPEEIIANFHKQTLNIIGDGFELDDEEDDEEKEDDDVGSIRAPDRRVAFREVADDFNDLGKSIPRDNSNITPDVVSLIEKFNDYPYGSSCMLNCMGSASMVGCFCFFPKSVRHVVRPGNLGVYRSSGRYMLLPPGIHYLKSFADTWEREIPIDDEQELVRQYGSKIIVLVPENHLGGAYRMGRRHGQSEDGEYVIFGQGRHVLCDEDYRGMEVQRLTGGTVKLGPLTVLYVKEGFVGGAFVRKKGIYKLLYPGPPYLLNEKDFEQIELQAITMDPFKVGPYNFLTVKEGELGGTFLKQGGTYQILPPGNTYQLHTKIYKRPELVKRRKKTNI